MDKPLMNPLLLYRKPNRHKKAFITLANRRRELLAAIKAEEEARARSMTPAQVPELEKAPAPIEAQPQTASSPQVKPDPIPEPAPVGQDVPTPAESATQVQNRQVQEWYEQQTAGEAQRQAAISKAQARLAKRDSEIAQNSRIRYRPARQVREEPTTWADGWPIDITELFRIY